MSVFLTDELASLTPYTPGEQPQDMENWIKLNTNENPYPPSAAVKKAISGKEIDELRLYSDPRCDDFLSALAAACSVKRPQVFASNGSDEALAFCFRAFCEKGAAFADITYGFYPVFASLFGIKTELIPLREDFTIAPEDYSRTDKTVFIANPNAPTSLALPRKEIERILAQNPNRLVVVDEAYVDFGAESCVTLIEQYDNLLVVGTFSKSRNLAGARIGFAIGNEQLIQDLNTVKFSFNPYNLNRLSLLAGTAAVKDKAYTKECCERIIATRQRSAAALRARGFRVLESSTNFLFAGQNELLAAKEYYELLKECKILIRYFDNERIKDFVRITVGTDEQMTLLLAATDEILREKRDERS